MDREKSSIDCPVIGVRIGGAVHKPRDVQEDCQPEFHKRISLRKIDGWAGRRLPLYMHCGMSGMRMTEREKAGADGRVIGGRIGSGTRKSRYVLEGSGRGFHYDYTVEI
ncbi:hypothetical protein Tsp_03540 [Trichinella spiralis]|uniref:hypothetical protein n=1 Tax=Trichinella spiralis TaxID=6334 RepID=UPI0001EFB626|nr:hypothetical protein Tsp_03540 [Trichinella spiralis]